MTIEFDNVRLAQAELPLPWGERAGVRGQGPFDKLIPPHPLALLATSPRRGEVIHVSSHQQIARLQ